MKTKKIIALLLSVCMLFLLMSACSSQTQANSSENSVSQAQDDMEQDATEKIEIIYWHTYTDQHEQALLTIVDGFNSSQNLYTLVPQQQPYSEFDSKLLQAVRNETGPDIVNMFPSDAINYINEGYLVDFSKFINDEEIGIPNFAENVPEGVYQEITQWGEESIYIFPWTIVGEVLFYNKTMFDKYELSAPTTWTDVENYSKIILQNEGIPGFGTDSATDTYQCLIMQAGSGYIDAENMKIDIDETIGKEKLNWFANGVKDGYFRLVGEDFYFSNPFGSQAVASYIGSSAGASYVFAAVGDAFEVGCVPIPQEGDEKYISQWGNNFVCFSTTDERAQGAYEFIKYATSKDIVADWAIAFGSIPVFTDAIETDKYQEFVSSSIVIQALEQQIQYVGMLPSVPGSNNVRTEIDKLIQNVALDVMDADSAYAEFIANAQSALDG